jgi:uncharacterized protein
VSGIGTRPQLCAPTKSCIYSGTIRHRRREPRREFRHRLALAYVDLDELPSLLGGRLVAPRPGALRFRAADYLGRGVVPLGVAVRDRLTALSGRRPRGPVRLLTQLRSFGLCFNPVSFYYCFDEDGDQVESVLAEVTNTPWGERHSYLLADRRPRSSVVSGRFAKELHVSPFMGMDHHYEARATSPGRTLSVHIESRRRDVAAFDATLNLQRRELTAASAARLSARFPLASVRVLALIYGHALGLKLAGTRVHPHPSAGTR